MSRISLCHFIARLLPFSRLSACSEIKSSSTIWVEKLFSCSDSFECITWKVNREIRIQDNCHDGPEVTKWTHLILLKLIANEYKLRDAYKQQRYQRTPENVFSSLESPSANLLLLLSDKLSRKDEHEKRKLLIFSQKWFQKWKAGRWEITSLAMCLSPSRVIFKCLSKLPKLLESCQSKKFYLKTSTRHFNIFRYSNSTVGVWRCRFQDSV